MSQEHFPLNWVTDFINSVRPYLSIRKEDRLIILLPNQAHKLNESAMEILQQVFNGETPEAIAEKSLNPARAREDMYYFFCDLKAMVSGCLGDGKGRKAVERIEYELPYSALPVLSEVALTYRCNLKCAFCYAGCNCTSREMHELDTGAMKKVLDCIKHDAKVPSVSFTGGEPTLRTDLVELIAYARQIGLRVNLISNGTRIIPEYAEELRHAGLNSVQISIEGPDAATHDNLTSVAGSFEKTIAGIGNMAETGIYTQTNTTLNAANVAVAEQIVDLIHDLGMERFAMNMLTPSGSASVNSHLYLTYTEIGEIVRKIKRRANQLGVEFLWYSPTPYCHFNPILEGLGNKSCAACDGLLSVDPQGNILPCSSFDSGVGNLLEDSFKTIWHSAQATFWRSKDYAPSECNGCDSFVACAGACPLYWQACGTDELKRINAMEAVL
jgi:radical SAM protein with 4Fe4S-binding SPASM domain